MSTPRQMPDCYDYVRNYYKVPAYVGVRVRTKFADAREGVLVKCQPSQYVTVLFDGDKRSTGPFHPTDLEYLPVGGTADANGR